MRTFYSRLSMGNVSFLPCHLFCIIRDGKREIVSKLENKSK